MKRRMHWWALSAVGVALCGCPVIQQDQPKPPAAKKVAGKPSNQAAQPESKPEPVAEPQPGPPPEATAGHLPQSLLEHKDSENEEPAKKRDLGPPLVDDAESLKKLDPVLPIWLDAKRKQVVMLAEVCKAGYPLEFFATYPMRDYESLVVVEQDEKRQPGEPQPPSIVHSALLLLGADSGHPARFDDKFEPATGTQIEIEVRWKDQQGTLQKARAQDWIRNIRTKKALDATWVFAGSGFWKDETTGKEIYQADSVGDFISVLNVPTATLDLPIESAGAIESRLFEGFVERIPPQGTPVTLIFTPKLDQAKTAEKAEAAQPPSPSEK